MNEKLCINANANAYASYHNPVVLVIVNHEGEGIGDQAKKPLSLWFFENDEIPKLCEVKAMRFAEYIRILKKKKIPYFAYYYGGKEWFWHTDAYKSFTKRHVDRFLKNHPECLKDKDYLNEKL